MLKAILGYRQFIYSCVRREFQTKYQQSLLGSLWAVLNPLAMIIVYINQAMHLFLLLLNNFYFYLSC